MAYQRELECFSFVSSVDLSSSKFKVVELVAGSPAPGLVRLAPLGTGTGILQNQPKAGEFASVAMEGESKAIAGGTVSLGDHCRVLSGGWVVKINSGDLSGIVDFGVIMSAAASGAITTVDIKPTLIANVVSGSIAQATP
jgi:hypothetical protein